MGLKRKRDALAENPNITNQPASKPKLRCDSDNDYLTVPKPIVWPRTPSKGALKWSSLPTPPSLNGRSGKTFFSTTSASSPTLSQPPDFSQDSVEAASAVKAEFERLQHALDRYAKAIPSKMKDVEKANRKIASHIKLLTLPVLDPRLLKRLPKSVRDLPAERAVRWNDPENITMKELITVCTPEVAAWSLQGMAEGLKQRGPAPAIPPALTNPIGCWLAQSREHAHGGHTQMAPLYDKAYRTPEQMCRSSKKRKEQQCHRLAIRAWGSWADLKRMAEDGWVVSHRCHQSNCFNIAHLVVETHQKNMMRKACSIAKRCECIMEPRCIFEKQAN